MIYIGMAVCGADADANRGEAEVRGSEQRKGLSSIRRILRSRQLQRLPPSAR